MKNLLLSLFALISVGIANSQSTFTSTISGYWDDAATWNTVPTGGSGGATNIINVAAGTTVTIRNNNSISGGQVDIYVRGILRFETNSGTDRLTLPTGSRIFVTTGAVIRPSCGGNSGVSCPSSNNDIIRIGSTTVYDVNIGQVYGPAAATSSTPFTAAQGAPLPVRFSNIKASEKGTGVQIDWTSYSEQNLANYQIERSADGINFTAVGEVAPRNVVDASNYSFFDALPLSGTNFYRIRNNDIDGKSGLSNIVKISLNKNIKTISVYPNPIRGNRVSFQTSDLAKGTYNVEVINAMGARVYQQSVNHAGGAINQSLILPTLQSGSYTLRINGTSSSSIHKITILQ